MVRIEGSVATPRSFGFEELAALPGQIPDVSALASGREGGAVRFRALLDAVGIEAATTEATLVSADGRFEQTAPLSALGEAVVIYRLGDAPLPQSAGGPERFLIPNVEECLARGVDRCTNVKALAIVRIR